MRFALPVLLVISTVASAAPVPVDRAAERQKLEAAWSDLLSYDPCAQVRAVFALLDHPRSDEFLAEKVPPVEADADRLKAWLKDLNSSSETLSRAAFEALRYHDPRVAFSAEEQIELAVTANAKRLLASVWWGSEIVFQPNITGVILKPCVFPGNGCRQFELYTSKGHGFGNGEGWGLSVYPMAKLESPVWQRAAVAAHILHAHNNKSGREILSRLANGAVEALPTRTAAGLLKAKPGELTDERFDAAWGELAGHSTLHRGRAVVTLVTPAAVARLKEQLPPIRASKDEVNGWLSALNDPDPKVWKPAFEKLAVFPPSLAFTPEEQCALITTDHGRGALAGVYNGGSMPVRIALGNQCDLTCVGDTLTFSWSQPGGVTTRCTFPVVPPAELNPPAWQRARVAILALERIGTKEARAVLEQLADGHPDVLPTREAKAALQRLK